MGDTAIEELFVLAADVGVPRIKVLIAPRDFRLHAGRDVEPARSPWVDELYRTLRAEMAASPRALNRPYGTNTKRSVFETTPSCFA